MRTVLRSALAGHSVFITDSDGKPGVMTTNIVKESMCVKMENYLEEDAIDFWDNLVTADETSTVAERKKDLRTQLENYRVHIELPKTVFQVTKKTQVKIL